MLNHLLLPWLTHPMSLRLGQSLLHFVWQGAVLGLIAGAATFGWRRSTAARQYGILLSLFSLMAAAPVLTFALLPQPTSPLASSPPINPVDDVVISNSSPIATIPRSVAADQERAPVNSLPAETSATPAGRAVDVAPPYPADPPPRQLEQSLPWLVAAWVVGVAVCSLRLLIGFIGVFRVRWLGRTPAPEFAQRICGELQHKLGLSRVIFVCESLLIQVPIVIGWLKPLILFPAGMITGLSEAQLRALLAHELAHLRRHDYLVNILQTVVETLLFYHPAVWWLSRRLRVEREHCCDDVVVELLGNRVEYGRALLAVEELRDQRYTLALGAADGSLGSRVRRIVGVGSDRAANSLWALPCFLACSFAILCSVHALGWHRASEPEHDDPETFVVVEWSAIVDESVLKELRALEPPSRNQVDAEPEMIRCPAAELHAVLQKQFSDRQRFLPAQHVKVIPPSPPGFRPTGIARTMSHSEIVRRDDRAQSPLSATWGGAGTVFLEAKPDAAKLRLKMHYNGSVSPDCRLQAAIEFDEDLPDDGAAVFVVSAQENDTAERSLIVVYEAMAVPADQLELAQQSLPIADWIRGGAVGVKQRTARAADWRSRDSLDVVDADANWTRDLPEGGHVQLVAIGRPKIAPMIWWSPDGKPISGIRPDLASSLLNLWDFDVAAVVRVWEDDQPRNQLGEGSSRSHGSIFELPDRFADAPGSQLLIVPAVMADDDGRPRLKIGAGFGDWTAETTIKAENEATGILNGLEIRMAGFHDFRDHTSSAFFWPPTEDFEITAVAVTKAGTAKEPTTNPIVYANEPPNSNSGAQFFDHPLSPAEFDHFLLKSRPCHWAEFTDFAVEPAELLNPPLDPNSATSPASTDAEALAQQFLVAIRRQKVPFLNETKIQELRQKLQDGMAPHLARPLTPERRQQLAAAIEANVKREFDPAEKDTLYLEFQNRFQTLVWELRRALDLPEPTPERVARLKSQREWMRAEVRKLPESAKFHLTHKDELAKVESLFDDALNPFFNAPMSDDDFAQFQAAYQKDTEGNRSETRLIFSAAWLFRAAWAVQRDGLLQKYPVENIGSVVHNLRWSLTVTRHAGNVSLDVADLQKQNRDIYVDVMKMIFVPGEAPADWDDHATWLLNQGQGDLAFDGNQDALIGVRGAKLAVLNATDWQSADLVPLAELKKLLETSGHEFLSLSTFVEADGDPANGIRRLRAAAPSIAIRTHEGNIAVIRILSMSGETPIIRARPRPLPPNPPLHPGDLAAAEPKDIEGDLHRDNRRIQETRDERPPQIANTGILSGRFVLDGPPPAPQDLSKSYEKVEVGKPLPRDKSGRVWGAHMGYLQYLQKNLKPKLEDRSLLVDQEGGIANVIVWVTSKDIPVTGREDLPPAVIEVRDGHFSPNVTVLQTGQTLQLENHDPVDVNISLSLNRNGSINPLLPANNLEQPFTTTFTKGESLPVKVQSNVVMWSTAWVMIRENSYVAVSRPDGTFDIPNLPPGEWEFRAWHERNGYINHWPKVQFRQRIQLGENSLGTIKLKPEFFQTEKPADEKSSSAPLTNDKQNIAEADTGSSKPEAELHPHSIPGTVIDKDTGQPITGATVRFRFLKMPSDRAGNDDSPPEFVFRDVGGFNFELSEHLRNHRNLYIERSAKHPDYQTLAPSMLPLDERLINAQQLRDFVGKIELHPGAVVTGKVIDLDGRPARGVPVFSGRNRSGWQNGCLHETVTDAEGRFRLIVPNQNPNNRGRIYLVPMHAAAVSRAITENYGEQEVYQLRRGTRVHGRVVNAQAHGVPGVVVRANAGERIPWRYAITDADGRYELPPCAYGEYVIELLDEGVVPGQKQPGVQLPDVYFGQKLTLPKNPPVEHSLNFEPVDSVRVTAHCVNNDETPAVGLNLTIGGAMKGGPYWRGILRPVVDEPGRYEVRVPRGLQQVRIEQESGNGTFFRIPGNWVVNLDDDFDGFEVRQFKAARVTLRATLDGEPFDLMTLKRNGPWPRFANEDAARQFGALRATAVGLVDPQAGTLRTDVHPEIDLVVQFEGFKPQVVHFQLEEGEERTIDVPLRSAAQEEEVGDLRSGPRRAQETRAERTAQASQLEVKNADGSPAVFNSVVRTTIGFPKSPPKSWVGWKNRQGLVPLEGLADGEHWLLAAPEFPLRTLLAVTMPMKDPVTHKRLRPPRRWLGKAIERGNHPTVELDDQQREIIVFEIENRSPEALEFSEEDLQLLSEVEHDWVRGLSPRWARADREPFPQTKIEAGQRGQLRLIWKDWYHKGFWSDRNSETIGEPTFPPPEEGKIWVKVGLGNSSSLPVLVSDLSAADEDEKTSQTEKYQPVSAAQPKLAGKIPDALWGKAHEGLKLALVMRDPDKTDWNELPDESALQTSIQVPSGRQIDGQLIVENVSDRDLDLSGFPNYADVDRQIEVRDQNGKDAWIAGVHLGPLLYPVRQHWRLKPGERFAFRMVAVQFGDPPIVEGPTISYRTPPGEYTLRCQLSFDNESKVNDDGEWTGTLTSGVVKVTVTESGREKPEKEERDDGAAAEAFGPEGEIKKAVSNPTAAARDQKVNSRLRSGQYTGAAQVMQIGQDGKISYSPALGICHMTVLEDGRVTVAFRNKQQIWTDVTLPLAESQPPRDEEQPPRTTWSAENNGYVYRATAIPYSPNAYVFRLEEWLDGKLIEGSQQFFAIGLDNPEADRGKMRVDQSGSGLVSGRYLGARQIMQIGDDGRITYTDDPPGICRISVLEDDRLKAAIPAERGMRTGVVLPLATTPGPQRRASWSAEIDGHTYRATAVPFSSNVYIFQLETLLNGKLIAGSQEFYAIKPKLKLVEPEDEQEPPIDPDRNADAPAGAESRIKLGKTEQGAKDRLSTAEKLPEVGEIVDSTDGWLSGEHGLQYRVRMETTSLADGELPLLYLEVRNRGTLTDLGLETHQSQHAVVVDGVKYVRRDQPWGGVDQIAPGADPITLAFALSGDWQQDSDSKTPLKLPHGKHRVVISLTIAPYHDPKLDQAQEGPRPPVEWRSLVSRPIEIDVGSRAWPGPDGSLALENIRRELAAFPHFHSPKVPANLQRLVKENQPAAGDDLVKVLTSDDAAQKEATAVVFGHSWDSMNRDQIERYLRATMTHFVKQRPQYPQGVDAMIGMGTEHRPGYLGLPEDRKYEAQTVTTHFLDGQPIAEPFSYPGLGAMTHWIKTKELALGRHTFRLATKFTFTRGGETYRGEYESPKYSFEIVSDDSSDDLIAEPDENLDRRILQVLLFAETDQDLRLLSEKNLRFEGIAQGDHDPWKPQISWRTKRGDGGGLHAPVWKLEQPLPVDLCFTVEFHIEDSDVVTRCTDLVVVAGESRQGYFSNAEFADYLSLRDHADAEGFVQGKLILKPSRGLALTEPQVRRYYDADITTPPLRFKVVPPPKAEE